MIQFTKEKKRRSLNMLKTHVRPSRDLRNNYADVVKTLEQHDHIIITNNGRGESVLISMESYADYEKYVHERYIYNELQKSKALLDDPNVELIPHEDAMERLRKQREARTYV
jgi:prevent-host-death family protein